MPGVEIYRAFDLCEQHVFNALNCACRYSANSCSRADTVAASQVLYNCWVLRQQVVRRGGGSFRASDLFTSFARLRLPGLNALP